MGALSAIILYVLVSTMSDADVEANRWRILGVALSVGLIEFVGTRVLVGLAWSAAILLVEIFIIAFALTAWCSLPRRQALQIAGASAIRVALTVVLILALPKAQHLGEGP